MPNCGAIVATLIRSVWDVTMLLISLFFCVLLRSRLPDATSSSSMSQMLHVQDYVHSAGQGWAVCCQVYVGPSPAEVHRMESTTACVDGRGDSEQPDVSWEFFVRPTRHHIKQSTSGPRYQKARAIFAQHSVGFRRGVERLACFCFPHLRLHLQLRVRAL